MKTYGMCIWFSAICLICDVATAQEATSNDSICQAAFDASPASKTCEIGLSPGRSAGVCSGVAKCGEGSYHMFFDISAAETKRLVDCSGTITPIANAPASCLTPAQKDTLAAESEAEKSACNDAWKKSPSATSCTATVDRSENKAGTCSIRARCQPGAKEAFYDGVSIALMRRLESCDGELQGGPCEVRTESAYEAGLRENEEKRQMLQRRATEAQSEYRTHDATCLAAWKISSAQQTCLTTEFITRSGGDMCQIHAQCSYGDRLASGAMSNMEVSETGAWVPIAKEKRSSVLSVSEEDLKKLVNCEGILKVGPCN